MHGRNAICRRCGAVLVEALLAIPVLVLVTFAGAQYAQVVVVEQAVQAAADAAAREAAKLSAAPAEQRVESVVNEHVGTFGLTMGNGVRVDLNGRHTPNSDVDSIPGPPSLPLARQEVGVTVQVQYAATRLPNALSYFGIDFSNRIFRATSVARVR